MTSTLVEDVALAAAQLEAGRFSWVWVVRQCPYCGDRHEHCGGPRASDPAAVLGHPVEAKCRGIDPKNFIADQTAAAPVPHYILVAHDRQP